MRSITFQSHIVYCTLRNAILCHITCEMPITFKYVILMLFIYNMLRIIRHHFNRTNTDKNILLKAAYSKYMYHIKSAFESGLFERQKFLNFKVVYSRDYIESGLF